MLQMKGREEYNQKQVEFDDYNYKYINEILQNVVVTTEHSEDEDDKSNLVEEDHTIHDDIGSERSLKLAEVLSIKKNKKVFNNNKITQIL